MAKLDKLPASIERAKAQWRVRLLAGITASKSNRDVLMAVGRINQAEAALDRAILEAINAKKT